MPDEFQSGQFQSAVSLWESSTGPPRVVTSPIGGEISASSPEAYEPPVTAPLGGTFGTPSLWQSAPQAPASPMATAPNPMATVPALGPDVFTSATENPFAMVGQSMPATGQSFAAGMGASYPAAPPSMFGSQMPMSSMPAAQVPPTSQTFPPMSFPALDASLYQRPDFPPLPPMGSSLDPSLGAPMTSMNLGPPVTSMSLGPPMTSTSLAFPMASAVSGPSPEAEAALAKKGKVEVKVRVSRLLDLPKVSDAASGYIVRVSAADASAEAGPFEASPTLASASAEDVELPRDEGVVVINTASALIVVTVERTKWLGIGRTLVGEAEIQRLDPRSRSVCPYQLSKRGVANPGGVELQVVEPSVRAKLAEPAGLKPSEHKVLASVTVDKVVEIPPAGMWGDAQLEIRVEPADAFSTAKQVAENRQVLGPYTVAKEPDKKKLRHAIVREETRVKGVLHGTNNGLVKVRLVAVYRGSWGDTEVGHANLNVTFTRQPVTRCELMKDQRLTGAVYVSYQLVEEAPPPQNPGDFFPQPAKRGIQQPSAQESSQVNELQARLLRLKKENQALHQELQQGPQTGCGDKLEQVMRELGPLVVRPTESLAPSLAPAVVPAKEVDGKLVAARLPEAQLLAPPEVLGGGGADRSTRFYDSEPRYNVMEDVWGLVQPHAVPAGKRVAGEYKSRAVREDCLLA